MKPCPNCKSKATKIVHMSAPEKPVECQVCGHRYDEHEKVVGRADRSVVMRLGEEITIDGKQLVVSSIWQTLGEEPDAYVLTRIPEGATASEALQGARSGMG